jgi:hypothetical protein
MTFPSRRNRRRPRCVCCWWRGESTYLSTTEDRAALNNIITQALEEALAQLDVKISQIGLKQRPPCLVMVVLPDSAAAQRKAVKAWGDVARQVATQCVVRVNLFVGLNNSQIPFSENHEV